MLARLAYMTRAYNARVGPLVTRSMTPIRSLRTTPPIEILLPQKTTGRLCRQRPETGNEGDEIIYRDPLKLFLLDLPLVGVHATGLFHRLDQILYFHPLRVELHHRFVVFQRHLCLLHPL